MKVLTEEENKRIKKLDTGDATLDDFVLWLEVFASCAVTPNTSQFDKGQIAAFNTCLIVLKQGVKRNNEVGKLLTKIERGTI